MDSDPEEIATDDDIHEGESDDDDFVPDDAQPALPEAIMVKWNVLEPPSPSPRGAIVVGESYIAHTFNSGWEVGRVVPKTKTASKPAPDAPPPPIFYVKYPSENAKYPHELSDDKYGEDKYWVLVSPKKDDSSAGLRPKKVRHVAYLHCALVDVCTCNACTCTCRFLILPRWCLRCTA